MAVDWASTILAYNRDYGTDFKSRKSLLSYLYAELKAFHKIATKLCLGVSTVGNAVRDDMIPSLPKGHRFPSPATKKILDLENTKEMTIKQMHEATGVAEAYIWTILHKRKMPYQIVKSGRRKHV